MARPTVNAGEIPRFQRDFFGSGELISRIGDGQIGGKAHGLLGARDAIEDAFTDDTFEDVRVTIPSLVAVTTEVFDAFVERNGLREIALSDEPDRRIAHAFQQGEIPPEFVGDLRGLIEGVRQPLAIRSSSLLEDALFRPFAGVYKTKMTPNNQLDADERFRKLCEAVKLVWASTFFAAPKRYVLATDRRIEDEKMAVIIQEVIGRHHGGRFYPDVSGVARSYNFYPAVNTRHEEGVVNIALGLGKTVVDGETTWFYPPTRPQTPPPFGSVGDQMKHTQTRFWAVNVGKPPAFDPVRESEYLAGCDLRDAERDGVLGHLASTYDATSDRLRLGIGSPGPRVLNFAPLLELDGFHFNEVVSNLLDTCERIVGGAVEIEFAMTMPPEPSGCARFGLLQVRPMLVGEDQTTVKADELARSDVVLASSRVVGNGTDQSITEIVYVRPESFDPSKTLEIANQIRRLNAEIRSRGKPYLLIGFGRWGSSDPSLGIPTSWDEISGARVIVEATLPNMEPELSQGSHFFHNLTSFKVCYLMIEHGDEPGVNWAWLNAQSAVEETSLVRHVSLARPLLVMVDGRSRLGVIRWAS